VRRQAGSLTLTDGFSSLGSGPTVKGGLRAKVSSGIVILKKKEKTPDMLLKFKKTVSPNISQSCHMNMNGAVDPI